MTTLRDFLYNFVINYADDKIRVPGAWMPYQQDAAERIFTSCVKQQAVTMTMLWSRQSGKTECISIALAAVSVYIFLASRSDHPLIEGFPYGAELERMFPEGFAIGIFACDELAAKRDYLRIQRIMNRIVNVFTLTVLMSNTEMMTLQGYGRDGNLRRIFHMERKSAAPAAKVEGGTFDAVVPEEAQDIEADKIQDGLIPTMAARAGSMFMIGTVGDRICYFDRQIDRNKAKHPDWHIEIPYEIPIQCNYQFGKYKTFVEQQKSEHGEDSVFFRRKFRLLRNYEAGMLISETGFLSIARPFEARWHIIPDDFPPHIVICISLDVAQSHDRSVMKIATADWQRVRRVGDEAGVSPLVTLRWQKTYPGQDYDHQFAEMIRDLDERFPGISGMAIMAVDATGDRGDMAPRFAKHGFTVIPVAFTGGGKSIDPDELMSGEKVSVSKSVMCNDYAHALTTGQFTYAADEAYMGTIDYYRALGEPVPNGHRILEPHPEYRAHKHECTHCFDETPRPGIRNLHKDKKDPDAHDDQVDADMLIELVAKYCRPFSLDDVKFIGESRTFSDFTGPDSRSFTHSLDRVFQS